MLRVGLLAVLASFAVSTTSASVAASESVGDFSASIDATPSYESPTVFISATAFAIGCTAIPGNPSCEKATCCLGSSGAWTGVNTAANIAYTDTVCVNDTATVNNSSKTCGELCVNKECDGAVGLAIRGTTIAISLFIYWALAVQQ